MSMTEQTMLENKRNTSNEAGQSIVLIAFMIIGLLAFVGLAADTGFLFARSSQFSSAVDAAALAGVVDLHQNGAVDVNSAIDRSGEFLNANGWPIAQAISITGTVGETDLGIPEFYYTVTWPVETHFMRILGFDEVPITRSSTAAYYALTNMPVSTHFDRSMVRMGNLFVMGPDGCTGQGDPVSSPYAAQGVANPDYPLTNGIYEYRIRVPADFITDTNQSNVIVQLFDPDTVNTRLSDSATVEHFDGSTSNLSCNSAGSGDSCVINTGEPATANPMWLVRVDETWTGRASPDDPCPTAAPGSPLGNSTFTRYELFYRDEDDTRVDVGAFESNASNSASTDMKWVTPGVNIAAASGTFNVNLDSVPLDDNDNYNVFLHVRSLSGTSKNAFDIWAGPAGLQSTTDLEQDVNERNLQVLTTPGMGNRYGVEVYGQGYLPVTVYRPGEVTLPVAAVDAVQGGGTIYASVFDFDQNANDPLEYGYDTIAPGDFLVTRSAVCEGDTNCNNKWVRPQHVMGIPTAGDNIAFYGGFLTVTYDNGGGSSPPRDELVWSVRVTAGRPFLTR